MIIVLTRYVVVYYTTDTVSFMCYTRNMRFEIAKIMFRKESSPFAAAASITRPDNKMADPELDHMSQGLSLESHLKSPK